MNEYNFKWIRFFWETLFSVFVICVGYKLLMIPLLMIQLTEGVTQLNYIIILGLMCFSIKFRIPSFYKFYSIRRYNNED